MTAKAVVRGPVGTHDKERMTHLDLFAGAGGASWFVWHVFVEEA